MDFKKKDFSAHELQIVAEKPGMPGRPGTETKLFNTPVSYRDNALSLFTDKKPCFVVTGSDFSALNCGFYQEKLARAARDEGVKVDTFGVKWTFEPTADGSISIGGNPRFEDVNDWKDIIQIPDVNDWDWAADAAAHQPDTRFPVQMTFINGFWFERLISFMDFMNAAMALVDEEQTEAIHELFSATTQLACDIVDKVCEYWPCVDGFMVHDDWGSQKAPFFSDEVAEELFLPYMKKLADHVHSKGRYFGIHSCGHIEERIHIFIKAGIDTWQMQANANDITSLYEQYGDKLVFQYTMPELDPADEQDCIDKARWFVDNWCKPGKPTMLVTRYVNHCPVFLKEVYEYSRKIFLQR